MRDMCIEGCVYVEDNDKTMLRTMIDTSHA